MYSAVPLSYSSAVQLYPKCEVMAALHCTKCAVSEWRVCVQLVSIYHATHHKCRQIERANQVKWKTYRFDRKSIDRVRATRTDCTAPVMAALNYYDNESISAYGVSCVALQINSLSRITIHWPEWLNTCAVREVALQCQTNVADRTELCTAISRLLQTRTNVGTGEWRFPNHIFAWNPNVQSELLNGV